MNLTSYIQSRLDIKRDTHNLLNEPYDIIALTGDARDLVFNEEDKDSRYLLAISYGLRDGLKPLYEAKDYRVEDLTTVISDYAEENDIDLDELAEAILILSDMEDCVYQYPSEINGDDLDQEALDTPIGELANPNGY